MKRYGLILIVVVMILASLFVPGAQAGKPKPTADPYFPPFEAQTYPAPPTPFVPDELPPEDQLYLQYPDADPVDGVPYFWGRLKVRINNQLVYAFWITLQGVGDQRALADGVLCISILLDPPPTKCDELHFYSYGPQSDINIWYTRMSYCDARYFISLVWLYGQGADFRGPHNEQYFERCIYFPGILRG